MVAAVNIDVGKIFGSFDNIINKIWPDASEAERNKLFAILKIADGQMAINRQEAKHTSIFVAGWRPAIGWISGAAIAYEGVLRPVLSWLSVNFGLIAPPSINTELFTTLLLAMLGVGGMRTLEKFGGVARNNMYEHIPEPTRRAAEQVIKRARSRSREHDDIHADDFVINP